jgi:hypothetical protein
MFPRFLAGFFLLLALVWGVLYLTGPAAVRRAAAEPWPYGLGTVQEAAERRPFQSSPESEQLAALVEPFTEVDAEPARVYVAAQISKIDDAIDPPGDVGLAEHEAQLAELVRYVDAHADRVRWSSYAVSSVTTLLAAAALDRARSGDAGAAWDDVHAIWILARSLAPTSGWRSQEQALLAVRNAAAIVRKLPAPAPRWVAEIAAYDPRRQTALISLDMEKLQVRRRHARGPIYTLMQPFVDRSLASQIRGARLAAEAMAALKPCSASAARQVYRASRMEAELEAMTKVLVLKAERARLGRWPAAPPGGDGSRCAGMHWEYSVQPDGSHMFLWISQELGPEWDAKSVPPVRFSY